MIELRILGCGEDPGLSRWAQCNHKVLTKERGRQVVRVRKIFEDSMLLVLKMEERFMSRNAGSLQKLE